ncbi:MAG TPA: tripartite tricarboxylate transporter TctB family protein [Alphaproteobacteria bacterium]|nr:tripartite tricarboxylate transporter TctB family protein [Alphaproteobacteria bacterium]
MEDRALKRADLITSVVLIVLGVLVAYGSWTMPRLEERHIHPSSVPGLVPGILGLALAVSGGLLLIRSWRNGGREGRASELWSATEMRRLGIVLALTLGYALGLVGTLPFWLATAIFVFAFIVIFERLSDTGPRSFVRSASFALIEAVIVAAATSYIFQEIFLVRLP